MREGDYEPRRHDRMSERKGWDQIKPKPNSDVFDAGINLFRYLIE